MTGRGHQGRTAAVVVGLLAVVGLLGLAPRAFGDPAKNPVSGGGPAKSDCYVVLDVQDATNIKKNKVVTCTDGDPCDTDGLCNDSCTFKVALCPNQPAASAGVSGCTAPTSLSSLTAKAKGVASFPQPPSLSGSACGAFTDVVVVEKGKKKKKPGKLVIHLKGKASSGKPKTDADNITLICAPRVGTCPPPTTTTTTMPPCATTPVPADLGLGCLYIGGGGATVIPPSLIPDGSTSYFDVSGNTLSASDGTGPATCSKGPGPGKHCVNQHCNTDADCDGTAGSCQGGINCVTGTQATPLACTGDNDCGGNAGTCGLDANCFFGPPLPILSPNPNGALTTCVLNVYSGDGSGTGDTNAGTSTVTVPLASRVYITGNTGSPCPKCSTGTCTYGEKAGQACATTTSLETSLDCPPPLKGFQAPLPVTLGPLTTGPAQMTAANAVFCPDQVHPGAFGHECITSITETGTPAGSLADNQPHHSILASVFCIPPTGNPAVDGIADLPGPGAIGLNGMAMLTPSSKLVFTTVLGTTSCGGGGLNPAPVAPFSGHIQ